MLENAEHCYNSLATLTVAVIILTLLMLIILDIWKPICLRLKPGRF